MFWLHAGSAARFEQSIRNTLEQLNEPGISDQDLDVFKLFRAWLLDRKQERVWMIILDNADDEEFLLQPPGVAGLHKNDGQSYQAENLERYLDYLPFFEHGTLLVTSRSRAAALSMVSSDDIIAVGPMDLTHGTMLLEQKLGKSAGSLDYTLEELAQLTKKLDSMPLAMAQAAAYILERRPRCSVKQYLDRLVSEQTRLDVLGQHTRDLRRDRNAQNCILKTWHITFEHIRQRESSAADLLSLMSFFDRNAIPEALLHTRAVDQTVTSSPDPPAHSSVRLSFRDFFNRRPTLRARSRRKHDEQQPDPPLNRKTQPSLNGRLDILTNVAAKEPTTNLDHDIQILRNYSLVKIVAGSPSFEMHGLVQFATQDWLTSNGTFERWGGQFMMNVNEAYPRAYDTEREVCQALFPHVLAAMEVKLSDRNSILGQASILEKGRMYVHTTGAYYVS